MKLHLSLSETRRIALSAQGFNAGTHQRRVDSAEMPVSTKQIEKTLNQLGVLQIDSVNVLTRAQYMPLFSRLGNYATDALDAIIVKKPRRFFEYWGHEASILPIDCYPLLQWRMQDAYQGKRIWNPLKPYAKDKRPVAEALLDRIRLDGPIVASDLREGQAGKGMWVWSEAKHALEWMFWSGLVAATHRRGNFERAYDLPERTLPTTILQQSVPDPVDAKRELLAHSARALGIATIEDLRDYYRLPSADVALPLGQLVEEGLVIPVKVDGWRHQGYMHKDAVGGRGIKGGVLLSPFDPLIWHRGRTERLFHFRYRIEIYTPAHKREYGYYVLPFMLDGAMIARVDLKADRQRGLLLVQQLHLEPGAPSDTLEHLSEELWRMAQWLGLPAVVFK